MPTPKNPEAGIFRPNLSDDWIIRVVYADLLLGENLRVRAAGLRPSHAVEIFLVERSRK